MGEIRCSAQYKVAPFVAGGTSNYFGFRQYIVPLAASSVWYSGSCSEDNAKIDVQGEADESVYRTCVHSGSVCANVSKPGAYCV